MRYSILYPHGEAPAMRQVSETTFHDLGLDRVVGSVGKNPAEQDMIRRIMCAMTKDADTARYRCDVFEDIYNHPGLRERILELLGKVNFIRDYGIRRDHDEKAGIWDLMHRLDEVNDYIRCTEDIHGCLAEYELKSEGLLGLKHYIDLVYDEAGFAALKKDIEELNASTADIKSVTLGINLNSRFEAEAVGVVSVNNKPFTRSGIIKNFHDRLSCENGIRMGNDWKDDYHFHVMNPDEGAGGMTIEEMVKLRTAMTNPLLAAGMGYIGQGDISGDITRYMDKIVNHMLNNVVGRLREVLSSHISVNIKDITDLIPEFTYYVRWAEYIERAKKKGWHFCKAQVRTVSALQDLPADSTTPVSSAGVGDTVTGSTVSGSMQAYGIYNLGLAVSGTHTPDEIVTNNLDFGPDHRVYILTGANRGGKTTITQTVGQLYVLAQGGIYVPGTAFSFTPVDGVYTHFPADEDKTLDLGRLGEECRRFKELYRACTRDSLLLLNETFSTTSFEEGYYIACDAVKALLTGGVSTIYNTHMHKLAYNIDELNEAVAAKDRAASLVVESEGGVCTYRVHVAAPEGMSYAHAIAEKYGVTFEELTSDVTI